MGLSLHEMLSRDGEMILKIGVLAYKFLLHSWWKILGGSEVKDIFHKSGQFFFQRFHNSKIDLQNSKIVLFWIVLEAISLVVSQFFNNSN